MHFTVATVKMGNTGHGRSTVCTNRGRRTFEARQHDAVNPRRLGDGLDTLARCKEGEARSTLSRRSSATSSDRAAGEASLVTKEEQTTHLHEVKAEALAANSLGQMNVVEVEDLGGAEGRRWANLIRIAAPMRPCACAHAPAPMRLPVPPGRLPRQT